MTDIASKRPIPIPDDASRPFFEGARRHELMLQRCNTCDAYMWPVKDRCDVCWSDDVRWVKASGKGTLYSFVLMHQLYHPGFADEIPYNVSIVDLAEGVRMTTNVVGLPNAELRVGMPLEVTFDDINEEITLPKFRPA